MSDDEIRVKIAEACGLSIVKVPFQPRTTTPDQYFTPEAAKQWRLVYPGSKAVRMLPDYLNDLNAMHVAVESLNKQQRHTYAVVLASNKWPGMRTWNDWRDTLAVSEATARERAEAFIRVIQP